MKIDKLINIPLLKISEIKLINSIIQIHATIKSKQSKCHVCGKSSCSIHDYYTRTIVDLPVFNNKTILVLKTRKFKCKNTNCSQKVFSEQISSIPKYARKTLRVSKILDTMSIELTGKLASTFSKQFSIDASHSSMIRIANNCQLPVIEQAKILGVDDWAFRKGVNYGTILVDMETSRPIDLLPTRNSADLKKWLKRFPNVNVFTRDRASSYSSAINEICPDAIQVADRFHLLMNLSDALDKYFKSIGSEIRTLIKDKTTEIITALDGNTNNSNNNTEMTTANDSQVFDIKTDKRIEIFNKVKELQEQDISISKMSRDLGISRITVSSYCSQKNLSPRKNSRSSNIEVFVNLIINRLNTKEYNIKNIIDEITKLGFTGSQSQAYNNINKIKENNNITNSSFVQNKVDKILFVRPLSSRLLAKYIDVSMLSIKDTDERKYLETLIESIPELKIIRKLVKMFKTMLRRKKGNIERWIDFIQRSKYKLTGIRSFAKGILRDISAVKNGINLAWSNGAVEGHVNRIKTKKRQMYGRAGFELLRRKVLLSQTG